MQASMSTLTIKILHDLQKDLEVLLTIAWAMLQDDTAQQATPQTFRL